jgi:hypothetical protein
MPERMTYYVAAPIARRDDGAVLCDEAIQCSSSEAAIECARQMARSPFYVGAWAFSRTGYPSLGWFEDAEVLRRFGDILAASSIMRADRPPDIRGRESKGPPRWTKPLGGPFFVRFTRPVWTGPTGCR